MEEQNPIIIYQSEDGNTQIEVKLENETVWLTQQQLCDLYQTSKSNISEHIKHIFDEGELEDNSAVRKFRTTASDGKIYNVSYYNLDTIISLGYRIRSRVATHFRKWATERLKEYIIKGFTMDDYVHQLDNILSSTGEQLLLDAGKVSHDEAMKKAETEYRKWQVNTISPVEQAYLDNIKAISKKGKKK